MFKIYLTKEASLKLTSFIPFIYNNEVTKFSGEIKTGTVCQIMSFYNKFLGYGFFNSASKIMIRVLTLKDEEINYDFFKERIKQALAHREVLNFSNCMRLIFSEADLLPGLVVDKYADILVVQFTCLGMYSIREDIKNILVELLSPRGIYYRNDININVKEGIPLEKGFLYNEFDTLVKVTENDISFYVDVCNGQKTGYFLDQKLNRDNLKYYVKDKVVLDCFSHTGGFALNAAKNKALEVVALDISQLACDTILANAKLNNFNNIKTLCCDAFEYLHSNDIIDKYDVIILDLPGFGQSEEPKEAWHLNDFVQMIYELLKSLNISNPILIGHSFGGKIALLYASAHPTKKLILFGSPFKVKKNPQSLKVKALKKLKKMK